MDCLICKGLERTFESRRSEYIEARSAAYYRVSTDVAAKKNVDMERARNDMEEHHFVCASATAVQGQIGIALGVNAEIVVQFGFPHV